MLRRLRAPHGALALPAWVFLLGFFVAPVALVVWYSFGYKPGLFGTHANDVLSLDRYGEALGGSFLRTFWNTLRIGVVGTLICLVVALPFAYWLAVKVPARWRGLLLALVLVPFWTNFLVRTLGWQIALSPEGPFSTALQAIGGGPLDVLYTRGAVQLGVVYNYLPLMLLPVYVALERTSQALREASRDLGAGRWRTFADVTLPLAFPGIASGCLLVFVPLMGDYVTATVLGGAKGNMVGQLVASQFQTAQNWALGSAMAVVLVLFTGGTVLLTAAVLLVVRRVVRASRRVDLEGVTA
ncbi:ABC transporter permease [Kineococcus sp. NBC_00420]|uniref:ABC transporter permease n=1 Tax=unclassified Kineococcus TaxID=2621656 RepID=UPI002E1BB844